MGAAAGAMIVPEAMIVGYREEVARPGAGHPLTGATGDGLFLRRFPPPFRPALAPAFAHKKHCTGHLRQKRASRSSFPIALIASPTRYRAKITPYLCPVRYLIFSLLLVLTARGVGQPLRIEYFTVNDGLSTRDINSLHAGKDGFLWVCTMDGLNRFDGQSFRRFGENPDTGEGLSRGAIENIATDEEGKFVVTFRDFYGYFDRFDPRDFSVEQVPLVPGTGVLGYPRAIVTDETGHTFVVSIGTEGTFIYRFRPESAVDGERFVPVFHDPADAWTTFAPRIALLPLRDGSFLLYDEMKGLRHISVGGELLGYVLPETTRAHSWYAFAEAAEGTVFISLANEQTPLFTWRPGEERAVALPPDVVDLSLVYPDIFRDERGQLLFLGTENILGRQFPDDYFLVDTAGNFTLLEEPLPRGRAIHDVVALDFRETVYLALREGLGIIERYVNPVNKALVVEEDDLLFRNSIQGITEDDQGRVYFAEEDGYVYFLDADRTVPDTVHLRAITDSTSRVRFRDGRDLCFDAQRQVLWLTAQPTGVGNTGGLLLRHELRSGLTKSYATRYPLEAIALSPQGELFIAATDPRKIGLLLRFAPETETFHPVVEAGTPERVIQGTRLNCLRFSRTGELLIGTRNRGLIAYLPDRQTLKYYNTARQPDGLPDLDVRAIFAIHETPTGDWWLGTESGLLHYRKQSGQSIRYGRGDGLSSNVVVGIVPDSTGGFWVSTHNGLIHLSPPFRRGNFRRYYREDGLSTDAFNPFAYHRSSDGRYFFGGDNGITFFREEDLSARTAGAETMLTEITVFGRNSERVLTRNLDELQRLTLQPYEKSAAISFALPVGQRPGSSQFRYRLEGFNDDWVPLTNERTVRFNNLKSGSYLLRVQGAGANGNYGEEELHLQLRIRQYVFEKFWFQLFVVLLVLSLIFFILRAKLLERLRNEQLRTQLSADIHDEVSGLLAGITLQAELLKNYTEDEKLQSRLHTVGEAGRSAMSKMSDVIWSIDSRRDTLGDLLQRMQEHADEVLLPIEIRYDFQARGLEEQKSLPGNIRQDVYFIYKEAINNIARHSDANRVKIRIEQSVHGFELMIQDNGTVPEGENLAAGATPGTRVPATSAAKLRARKKGQGKDNMKMRAARLKGKLETIEGNGYTLRFSMKRLPG